jgi:hypothetical protein
LAPSLRQIYLTDGFGSSGEALAGLRKKVRWIVYRPSRRSRPSPEAVPEDLQQENERIQAQLIRQQSDLIDLKKRIDFFALNVRTTNTTNNTRNPTLGEPISRDPWTACRTEWPRLPLQGQLAQFLSPTS